MPLCYLNHFLQLCDWLRRIDKILRIGTWNQKKVLGHKTGQKPATYIGTERVSTQIQTNGDRRLSAMLSPPVVLKSGSPTSTLVLYNVYNTNRDRRRLWFWGLPVPADPVFNTISPDLTVFKAALARSDNKLSFAAAGTLLKIKLTFAQLEIFQDFRWVGWEMIWEINIWM